MLREGYELVRDFAKRKCAKPIASRSRHLMGNVDVLISCCRFQKLWHFPCSLSHLKMRVSCATKPSREMLVFTTAMKHLSACKFGQ